MTLTNKEYKEFLKTHLELLFYVGQQMSIIPAKTKFDAFLNLDFKVKFKCREALFKNEKLLDTYLTINFNQLTIEQIKILTGFKKKIKSDFVIFRCLTNNAIFIDTKDNKFYSVKALGDPFDVFFDKFPVLITTILLPFKNKIIYDGFIQSSGVYFGPGTARSMNEEYKEAKKQKQILTTID